MAPVPSIFSQTAGTARKLDLLTASPAPLSHLLPSHCTYPHLCTPGWCSTSLMFPLLSLPANLPTCCCLSLALPSAPPPAVRMCPPPAAQSTCWFLTTPSVFCCLTLSQLNHFPVTHLKYCLTCYRAMSSWKAISTLSS